jgi:hypothetical protein
MKPTLLRSWLVVSLSLVAGLPRQTSADVTFTNDTLISFNNTNFDGVNITITNCTVTIDGAHFFASLQVLNGGRVTHSTGTNGLLANPFYTTNEQQILVGLTGVDLNSNNIVLASVVVWNVTRTLTYTNGVDYTVGYDTNGLVLLQRTAISAIADGATVSVDYTSQGPQVPTGLNLNVVGDVSVFSGGAITADGRGFWNGAGAGPGVGGALNNSGGGGGFGGYGGSSASNAPGGIAYGSMSQPADKGSGGGSGPTGPGGNGGGLIQLTIGGTLTVNGSVTASGLNATNDRSGGGSGGGIWLSGGTIAGSGFIMADGGAGEPVTGGGGGGGRIALYYTNNSFSGILSARGAAGATRGGAGTIYSKAATASVGNVLVDNGGRPGANTLLVASEAFNLTVQGGAVMSLSSAQTIGSLTLNSNAWLMMSLSALTINGDASIQSGAGVVADGAGYPGADGPGSGASATIAAFGVTGGGGGYGGRGAPSWPGVAGGVAYSLIPQPADRGSGGGTGAGTTPYSAGGSGGGAVVLTVSGMLALDGRISADGKPGIGQGSGGGSGGRVLLIVGGMSGAGSISASGGPGNDLGGGGGGGRIAIYFQSNSFAGTMKATGASGGGGYGGAGTIYTKGPSQPVGTVLVDNGGNPAASTPIQAPEAFYLTAQGGANPVAAASLSLGGLVIGANTSLLMSNYNLTVSDYADIQPGGLLSVDGVGYASGAGSGAGRTTFYEPAGSIGIYSGGGGGHGGYGASSALGAQGGVGYGSGLAPISFGSGGGAGSSPAGTGGAGGGALRLVVLGLLQVDGRISANGLSGTTNNAGGGAGGSLYLTVGGLSGTGVISANGGTGLGLGGGGGGGRIAIGYSSNQFNGTISAFGGGTGTNVGGAGSVYVQGPKPSAPQVIFDNGGNRGTNTDFSSLSAGGIFDLIVQRGAFLTNLTSTIVNSLVIGSNSRAFVATATISVINNATIQAGGSLAADGTGYPAGAGPGPGRTYINAAGGGGNGGYGASGGSALAYGGQASGFSYQSQIMGSGGGTVSTNLGGAGGGFIRLNVTGVLQVDGGLSANGGSAVGGSGAGAGGSLYISAGSLKGAGLISANGGNAAGLGGGGGGGRITLLAPNGQIPPPTNAFTGQISAYGGSGYGRGGAGTIYSRPSNQFYGLILVDNGGIPGTNTVANDSGTFDLTIRNAGSFIQTSSAFSMRNLVVGSNSFLLVSNQIASGQTISVVGNATVQAGGAITADRFGAAGGLGLGAGNNQNPRGGGGYGGFGGGNPASGSYGRAYGVLQTPIDFGSGGGNGSGSNFAPLGGAGGGAVRLSVMGVLVVDGRISADGGNGDSSSGGGSGGTVWLGVGGLSGAGSISANGGAGNGTAGGGGGGRIAISYNTNSFIGAITCRGGAGAAFGGAGTIYTKANNQSAGLVVLDNNGSAGTNSSLGRLSATPFDVVLNPGASLAPAPGTTTLRNLTVASNAWMTFVGQGATVTVTGDATVGLGGGIVADGTGSIGGQGIGPGGTGTSSYGQTGGGGGHGGYGANSTPGSAGGNVYDTIENPIIAGSSGGLGVGSPPYDLGGAGGGAINLNVTGTLMNNGRISAGGAAGTGQGSGGGSGGSVLLSAGTLAGSGTISANGGAGNGLGGGGGGGRVAISHNSNLFTGALAAGGGAGANRGGAGTIYSSNFFQLGGQVTIDNGGYVGTNTPFMPARIENLLVKGGAVATLGTVGYVTVSNLAISDSGTLLADRKATNLDVVVLADASIATNGAILEDGHGYVMGNGPGAGETTNSTGSGAGYGGSGGASSLLAGGAAYGSPLEPIDWGSGGGAGYGGFSPGSDGGGAIRFTVAGTLTVDGQVSANGNPGIQDDSGGGSGGSILLTAGILKGDGSISANGGMGQLYSGGGGAGGRIAIYSRTNHFTGQTTADGELGFLDGQDGSIFFSGSIPPPAVISQTPVGIVSNGVSLISVTFSSPVNPVTVYNAFFTLNTPIGSLVQQAGQGPITISLTGPETAQFAFPVQTTPGNYTFTILKEIQDLFGQPMSQVYTGAFTVSVPVIQGIITNSLGQPVAGVVLQPSLGSPATTDAAGNYTLGVLPGSSPSIYPSKAGLMFVPGSRAYTTVTSNISNENYLAVTTIGPTITAQIQGTNVVNSWYGIGGVTYQAYYSTDLITWLPYNGPLPGTNGVMQLLLPIDNTPTKFLRVSASN